MSPAFLTHHATSGELAAMIRGRQGEARTGLAEPVRLALLVRSQISQAMTIAEAVNVHLWELNPSLIAWEGTETLATIVRFVCEGKNPRIEVSRGCPPKDEGTNGVLSFRLAPREKR